MPGELHLSEELPDWVGALLDLVDAIPPGRVMTYGDLAALLDCGPRQVGAAMSRYGAMVPWWRVVNATGTLPTHLRDRAAVEYRREGTPLRPGRASARQRAAGHGSAQAQAQGQGPARAGASRALAQAQGPGSVAGRGEAAAVDLSRARFSVGG